MAQRAKLTFLLGLVVSLTTHVGVQGVLAEADVIKKGVVKLSVHRTAEDKDTGAGIIVGVQNQTAYILTAFHVVAGDEARRDNYDWGRIQIDVLFYESPGRQFKGRVLKYDETFDFAIIMVEDEKVRDAGIGIEFSLGDLSGVKEPYPILTIGHPRSDDWAVASGEIRRIEAPDFFNFTANAVEPGYSGGPLIDGRRSVLLGLVTQINAANPPFGRAVNIDYIVKKLNAWRIPHGLRLGKMSKSMVVIPAGEFVMGFDDPDRDFYPRRVIYLDEFLIDKYEVTVEEFARFAKETGYEYKAKLLSCNYGVAGKEKHPMNCVTWSDANAYAQWAGKSLPTEAEWEKAARGISGFIYPWGNGAINPADTVIAGTETAPVGSRSKDASPYGVIDMFGNVSEWVDDWYDRNSYRTRNPSGPAQGEDKVLRGGSFETQPQNAALFVRRKNLPTAGRFYASYGFRCVVRKRG